MLSIFTTALLVSLSLSPQAPDPTDALKTCLADSTSGKDRKDLARWVFLSMAAHPEIKEHASANATSALDESARTIGAMVTRLLTNSCVTETRAVMKTGQVARSLEVAFEGLGQFAMRELMADKAVQDAMGRFATYLDQKRLTDALIAK